MKTYIKHFMLLCALALATVPIKAEYFWNTIDLSLARSAVTTAPYFAAGLTTGFLAVFAGLKMWSNRNKPELEENKGQGPSGGETVKEKPLQLAHPGVDLSRGGMFYYNQPKRYLYGDWKRYCNSVKKASECVELWKKISDGYQELIQYFSSILNSFESGTINDALAKEKHEIVQAFNSLENTEQGAEALRLVNSIVSVQAQSDILKSIETITDQLQRILDALNVAESFVPSKDYPHSESKPAFLSNIAGPRGIYKALAFTEENKIPHFEDVVAQFKKLKSQPLREEDRSQYDSMQAVVGNRTGYICYNTWLQGESLDLFAIKPEYNETIVYSAMILETYQSALIELQEKVQQLTFK